MKSKYVSMTPTSWNCLSLLTAVLKLAFSLVEVSMQNGTAYFTYRRKRKTQEAFLMSFCVTVLRSANFSPAHSPRHTRGYRERGWPTNSGELRHWLLSCLDGFLCCYSGDTLSYQGSSKTSWLCCHWVIPDTVLSRKNGEECVVCKTPCDCFWSRLCRLGDFVCLFFPSSNLKSVPHLDPNRTEHVVKMYWQQTCAYDRWI